MIIPWVSNLVPPRSMRGHSWTPALRKSFRERQFLGRVKLRGGTKLLTHGKRLFTMIGPLVIVQCIWYVAHNWKDSTFLQLFGRLNGIYSRLKRSNNTVICCVQIISNNIHTPFEIELWDSGWLFDVRCLHSNEISSLIASYSLRIFFIQIAWPSTNYIKYNATSVVDLLILSKILHRLCFYGVLSKTVRRCRF